MEVSYTMKVDILGKYLLLWQILRKGGHDIPKAKEKLEEAEKQISKKNWREAFEDISAAKYYLMETDVYTEPLVDAFEAALNVAWKLLRGKGGSIRTLRNHLKRIKELIEKPKGKKARYPTRVATVRDARLWEAAKRLVTEEYGLTEDKDEEKYWALVSRIFTRMRYRLGGLAEEKVERFLEEIRTKEGKLELPTKKVVKLSEKIRRGEE